MIRQFLDLSTAHITEQTNRALTQLCETDYWPHGEDVPNTNALHYGYHTTGDTMTTRYYYHRMRGDDLRQTLGDLELSYSEFARLTGAQERRIGQWIHGHEDIPHHIRVMCMLMCLPGAIDITRQLTDACEDDRDEIAERKETA